MGPSSRPDTGVVAAALAIAAGLLVRALLLPTAGYADDIDQFAIWANHIATAGLGNAYDAPLSFGPVMALIWGVLTAVTPTFAQATDGSALDVRVLLKLPAVLADLGLAVAVWFALRDRPRWALVGVAVVLAHPGIWFVSAWWGQYESVFALLVLLAYLVATRGRDALAVVLLTAALLTKPQVAPLLVPFAAWFLARAGWRRPAGLARLLALAGVAVLTAAALWLPFVAADGPRRYLAALATYQSDVYSFLSLYAWNFWWLVQEALAGGALIPDAQAFAGPLTFRATGYVLSGALLVLVFVGVWRRPTPRGLALGVVAAALVAFAFLTTMHERYAYAGVVFGALLLDARRTRWLAIALGAAFFLNLVAAASRDYLGGVLPVTGPLGLAGAVVMVWVSAAYLFELLRDRGDDLAAAASPPGTSAGSAGAIS